MASADRFLVLSWVQRPAPDVTAAHRQQSPSPNRLSCTTCQRSCSRDLRPNPLAHLVHTPTDNSSPAVPNTPSSSCTQYVEDIARARRVVGFGAPELVKLCQFFDHPLFVEMFTDAIGAAA